MGELSRAGAHTSNGERTPAELKSKADELMRKIENERLISGWCWGPLTETMAKLSALPDDLAWVTVAYLSDVIVKRDAMFKGSASQQHLDGLDTGELYPSVPCRCGTEVPGERPTRTHGRYVVNVKCPDCGIDLVTFDDEPFTRPTLISRGMSG